MRRLPHAPIWALSFLLFEQPDVSVNSWDISCPFRNLPIVSLIRHSFHVLFGAVPSTCGFDSKKSGDLWKILWFFYHGLCNFFLESFFFLFHFFNLFLEWVNQRQIIQCDVIIIIFYVTLSGFTFWCHLVANKRARLKCSTFYLNDFSWFFIKAWICPFFRSSISWISVRRLNSKISRSSFIFFSNFWTISFERRSKFSLRSVILKKGFRFCSYLWCLYLLHVLFFDKLLDLILMRQL